MHFGKMTNVIFLFHRERMCKKGAAVAASPGTQWKRWQTQAHSLHGLLIQKELITFSESPSPYLKQHNEYKKSITVPPTT